MMTRIFHTSHIVNYIGQTFMRDVDDQVMHNVSMRIIHTLESGINYVEIEQSIIGSFDKNPL